MPYSDPVKKKRYNETTKKAYDRKYRQGENWKKYQREFRKKTTIKKRNELQEWVYNFVSDMEIDEPNSIAYRAAVTLWYTMRSGMSRWWIIAKNLGYNSREVEKFFDMWAKSGLWDGRLIYWEDTPDDLSIIIQTCCFALCAEGQLVAIQYEAPPEKFKPTKEHIGLAFLDDAISAAYITSVFDCPSNIERHEAEPEYVTPFELDSVYKTTIDMNIFTSLFNRFRKSVESKKGSLDVVLEISTADLLAGNYDKAKIKEPTYGEHMRSNPPIPEAELRDVIPLSGTTKGEGEPWFDPRATLAMNEQNRQYYEAAKSLTTKTEKVLLALKVFGGGSAAFVGRKTGLGTKTCSSVLGDLKTRGKVESEKSCREEGKLVESYSLYKPYIVGD